MPDSHSPNHDFLNRIAEIIEENISNEQFGVSELAGKIGMSRSNLLRRVKKLTGLSVSQFIRQVRLKSAMEMLRQNSLNVSEVSYKVGFSSSSYFIKCFREYYGYPPGEVGKRDFPEADPVQKKPPSRRGLMMILLSAELLVVMAVVLILVFKPFSTVQADLEKSIAVLPFKNDSNDSTNVYLINGLMESILNDLQKIEDLKVISRTSVEKYRYTTKTIPEIARELNVNYFVEGSGQKIGDQILLNVQLIEAQSDRHLWGEQYNREAKDIFNLQKEVSRSIADEIEVIITPEEEDRINKVPTDNLKAYDLFLKGLDLFYQRNYTSLEEAITYFRKAVHHDDQFARAYANIGIAYFFLDAIQAEKRYADSINKYADMAILIDPQLVQSLIAKALYFMNNGEYKEALPYLEKALEYNPNSALVINILSDYYTSYVPNTEKYIEYALKGIELDIASNDSVTASFIFLHVSNAFIQSGFIDEAEKYLARSFEYDPENLFSEQLRAYLLLSKHRDLHQTKEVLLDALEKDTTRLDIVQEVGKVYYYLRDYENSFTYYRKFVDIRKAFDLNMYTGENGKIGMVFSEMGFEEESGRLFEAYKAYADNDQSIYKHLSLSAYYSWMGDVERAIDHLKQYSQQDNYNYWLILFLEIDPLMDNIREHPEFREILDDIDAKFWRTHERIRATLERKRLI